MSMSTDISSHRLAIASCINHRLDPIWILNLLLLILFIYFRRYPSFHLMSIDIDLCQVKSSVNVN